MISLMASSPAGLELFIPSERQIKHITEKEIKALCGVVTDTNIVTFYYT